MCCCEIDRIVAKKGENESDIQCIVNHEGFDPVCLNLWVLQAAYFSFNETLKCRAFLAQRYSVVRIHGTCMSARDRARVVL